jgi:two-component system C4-dicarboxylate transport response regulator DctD
MKKQVLLIEDDDALRASLAQMLDLEGITVIQANGFAQAKRTIRSNFSGVILSDIRMPYKDGFDILAYVQSVDEELPVVMLTGEADVPMALRAMKEGAYDFLEKPCASSQVLEVLARALAHRALVTRTRQMEQQIRRNDIAAMNFPGTSEAVKNLRSNLRQVASKPLHVHLYGDIGVGKKIAAHTIHSLSIAEGAFVPFNLETAFHKLQLPEKTAVLSLKNIECASPDIQDQIIDILEMNPQLKILTSSTKPLKLLSDCGLSEQFLTKLDPIDIYVPTLSQRRKDLPVLFESLMRQSARALNTDMPQIPQNIYAQLIAKDWAGNLPALRNFATTIVVGLNLHTNKDDELTLAQQMDVFEKLILTETLKRTNGKATHAAQTLGLPRKTFYDRLARYDLQPKDFRAS